MAIFSGISTEKRNTVSEPEGGDLFKGVLWIAVGVLAVSVLTVDISGMIKLACAGIGVVLMGKGLLQLAKYRKDAQAFKDFEPAWDKKNVIYDRFAEELNDWYKKENVPEDGDGDIAYFLRLQKSRLAHKGLRMEKRVVPSKGTGYGTGKKSRKSPWYTTDMLYEQVSGKLSFLNGSETVFEQKSEMTMYEIVVHTPDAAKADHIRITCPQCGAVNFARKLEEGCPYCGTKFRIKDLFPRVVNFFFIKSKSISSNKQIFTQSMALSMAVVFVFTFISNMIHPSGILPVMLLQSYLAALLVGGFLGYIIADVRLIAGVLDRDGMKHISMWKWMSSKRKITHTMQKYDRNFSFDKFEGQLVALIRMAVMAENPENLACYHANEREAEFSNILEMTYTNGICLNKIWLEGDLMHISLRTWWVNYHGKDGKIRKTGDCIDATFVKNIRNQETPGFSITSVSCDSCGGSFDAVRQKTCPYCGKEYHMENESWMMEEMRLVR